MQTLEMLGLSASQSKIYLNLTVLKEATVIRVSKVSNIDRGETYRVMTKLVELGLVEKIVDSPLRFKAVPLTSGLSILLNMRKKESVEIQKKAQEMITHYSMFDLKEGAAKEEGKTLLVLSANRMSGLLNEKLKGLKKNYEAIMSLGEFEQDIKEHYGLYKRFSADGIAFRFIVELPEGKKYTSKLLKLLQNNPNFNVKFVVGAIPSSIGLYDGQEVRIGLEKNGCDPNSSAYWSNSPIFVTLATTYFETIWSRCK